MKSIPLVLLICLLLQMEVVSQTEADTYQWPTDSLVRKKLDAWQDMKFGVLITWGLYSQKGILESWGLCPEDEDWIGRNGYTDYFGYARDYRETARIFNPHQFQPEKWSESCRKGGVKYMIFVTKHHDGFCMFDSKFTDFKITNPDYPFSAHPRSNIAKEIFSAFRNEGLSVGAYFSKPDWSSSDFWWPYFPPKDRNPNFDITKHPERWNNYIKYTHNQLNELVTDYGKLDILWLDGCWVRPLNTLNERVEEFCRYPYDMDIDMASIASNARKKQAGILVVDRWVPGPYEDYLTPEQKTPDQALSVPWESCITMATDWGWTPNAKYKSAEQLIQLLVNIVAKGGNLLLGIGPDKEGEFDSIVYQRLETIGAWLDLNGEAIYSTRPVEPFKENDIAYTSRGSDTLYAIYLPELTKPLIPAEIFIRTQMQDQLKVTALHTMKPLKYRKTNGGIFVAIPEKLRLLMSNQPAFVIRICK